VTEEPPTYWLAAWPLVWFGGWMAVSIILRKARGKPIFPRLPRDAVYSQRAGSGWNDRHFLGRMGGARRVLLVAVTEEELIVCPDFPANLFVPPWSGGPEFQTPLRGIHRVYERRWFRNPAVMVELIDGRRFGLALRRPEAFMRGLGYA